MALAQDEMEFVLHCPFTATIQGPTFCGKTEFVLDLIERRHEITSQRLEKVIYMFGSMQSRFDEFSKKHNDIIFSDNLDELPKLATPNSLVIFDDLMLNFENEKNTMLSELFVKGAHHRLISVILITQNCFPRRFRTISINTMFKVYFNQISDKSTISHIGRQYAPGMPNYIRDSYSKATAKKFRPLIIDCHQFSNDLYRVRTSFFPSEDCEIYLPA